MIQKSKEQVLEEIGQEGETALKLSNSEIDPFRYLDFMSSDYETLMNLLVSTLNNKNKHYKPDSDFFAVLKVFHLKFKMDFSTKFLKGLMQGSNLSNHSKLYRMIKRVLLVTDKQFKRRIIQDFQKYEVFVSDYTSNTNEQIYSLNYPMSEDEKNLFVSLQDYANKNEFSRFSALEGVYPHPFKLNEWEQKQELRNSINRSGKVVLLSAHKQTIGKSFNRGIKETFYFVVEDGINKSFHYKCTSKEKAKELFNLITKEGLN
jgi:hypothetical protein